MYCEIAANDCLPTCEQLNIGQCLDCAHYQCGGIRPNYPVPTIKRINPLIEAYILRDILAWLTRQDH
jgi:hypothetical protein